MKSIKIPNNPIEIKHNKMSYYDMSKISGLHHQTIRNLAYMSDKELLNVSIETAIKLKKYLNIDILSHIDYDKIKADSNQ